MGLVTQYLGFLLSMYSIVNEKQRSAGTPGIIVENPNGFVDNMSEVSGCFGDPKILLILSINHLDLPLLFLVCRGSSSFSFTVFGPGDHDGLSLAP